MSKPITIDQEVPKPLEALTKPKIADYNVAIERAMLEERKRRLEPILPFFTRWRLARRAAGLHKKLNAARWNQLCDERQQAYITVVDGCKRRATLQVRLASERSDDLERRYKACNAKTRDAIQRCRKASERLRSLQAEATEYAEAVRALDAHVAAVHFEREERENRKQFYKEARWLESLLVGVFRNDKRCHYLGTDRKGREYRVTPKFQRISVDTDSIWFQLATSRRGMFGWKNLLPYNVSVEDLVSEETLENMRAVTGRQVEIKRGMNGVSIWFVVNRLDSPDGLPAFVPYKKLLAHYPSEQHELLPYPIGVKAGRKTVWHSFGELPHILLAGSSQSGKSNLLNCIIATTINMNSPQECRLLLIDLKGGIELSHFAGIKHLVKPMISNVDDLLPALQFISDKMRKRFDRLTETGTKDILEYNASVDVSRRMPRVLICFDEMATFLGLGRLTVQIHNELREITGKGRAVGIHTILCNQYTNVDAIPGFVKTNLAERISGAMPSGSASMTVLDTHSAKDLPRQPGRMIDSIGAVETIVQTAYISTEEIAEAVANARDYDDPGELDSLMDVIVEAAPEPEPVIELTERERMVLQVLATQPDGQGMSERKIANEVMLPKIAVHRTLASLASKGLVGKLAGSCGIVDQGRIALNRFTPGSVNGSDELNNGSDGSPVISMPDDQLPVMTLQELEALARQHVDGIEPEPEEPDLEAIGMMDLMSDLNLDIQEILKDDAA